VKPRSFIVLSALLAALASGGVDAQRSSGEIRFLKMNVPGKVERVAWAVQRGRCSVQIWGPSFRTGPGDPTINEIQAHQALLPLTQVWLLTTDGTAIPQTRNPERGSVVDVDDGSGHSVVAFHFPASARTRAISVVVSVDGQFFVEPLPYVK
jgi:hypothetical protein